MGEKEKKIKQGRIRLIFYDHKMVKPHPLENQNRKGNFWIISDSQSTLNPEVIKTQRQQPPSTVTTPKSYAMRQTDGPAAKHDNQVGRVD